MTLAAQPKSTQVERRPLTYYYLFLPIIITANEKEDSLP